LGNQNGFKLNDTYQLMVYGHDDDDDASILGGTVHTIKKNTADVIVAGKEIGLEVNADK